MSLDLNHEIVQKLVATGKWGDRAAAIGLRARFKCEYCDRDLLETPDNFKTWQEDHIVPKFLGGDPSADANLALSCRECNVNFKSRWDPRSIAGNEASREDLIAAVRTHVEEQREKTKQEIHYYRIIVHDST